MSASLGGPPMVGLTSGIESEVPLGNTRESNDVCDEGPCIKSGNYESGIGECKSFA